MPKSLKNPIRGAARFATIAALLLCLIVPRAEAQVLAIDNDIQFRETLANTTVTLTGRSELRITGTGTPLSGCTIHLNSSDSWLLFTSVKPSAVNNAAYLNQIRVNGANAALNANIRIVQYGEGAVVIPHASNFAPMEIFTGSHFTGSSMALTNYTNYNDNTLGAFNDRIRSFRLKRGYTATVATNANGTGVSRNYVAQDGDIEVAVLPEELTGSISFIRVFPWRWVTKKGSCDVGAGALNSTWFYNWDINQNSPLDWEYVAIKQQPNWPGLNQNWQVRQVNHLLGFNEPDNPAEDAYQNLTPPGSASDAVARWPELLGTGLRVGAPAVTDGGTGWITSFINQADAAGHRVDYVPVHYYRSHAGNNPAGAATAMYNFLKSIHDVARRPIWVTEFNNGANWTNNAHDPNVTQNRDVIQAMIQMMDNTPWIERYAIYSRVEWFRQTHYDEGGITPMGAMYRDHVAPIAYQQVIPEIPTPPAARYRFENDARDSSANGHAAMLKGAATYAPGKNGKAVKLSGDPARADHVQLSSRLGDSADFTFSAWVYWDGGGDWQRIFDLGADTERYLFLTPAAGGTGNLRFAIRNGGAEQQINHNAPLPVNTWTHVAVTIGGNTGKLFVNGQLVGQNHSMTINPSDLGTSNNFLGKSRFAGDPYFAGLLDDVRFLPNALSDAQVAALPDNNPPEFTSSVIPGGAATQGVPYHGTLAGAATDPDPGDTITFGKHYGPAWLNVAADGTLTGTPTFEDEGVQEFIVSATDSIGASAVAVLTIQLPDILGNGTWIANGGGDWSDTTKWSGGFPANGGGNTANFATLNIAADTTVNLDSNRKLGSLQFGDTSGSQSWTLASDSGKTLTLETSSGTPSITVNQNTATIAVPLAGTGGLDKTGAGTLALTGDNALGGTFNIDDGSSSGNGGVTRLAHPNAAAAFSTIQILKNNSGSSTLELDGASGPVTVPAALNLSGRNNSVPAIRNVSGENILSGTISVQTGGSDYRLHSNAGRLVLSGTTGSGGVSLRSEAGGARTFTLQGAGDGVIGGSIVNGNADTVNVAKTGTGTWSLSAINSYTGTTTVSQGTLLVNGSTGTGAATVANNAMLGGRGIVRGNLTGQSGSTIRVGGEGLPPPRDDSFALIDDFDSYPTGGIGAVPNTTGNAWLGVHNGTANALIVNNAGDKALAVHGINASDGWRGAVTNLANSHATDFSLPHGQTGTYFFRIRRTGTAAIDAIFGLTDQPAATNSPPGNDTGSPWDEYAIMLSIAGNPSNGMLRAYSPGEGDLNVVSMTTSQWLNVWIVVDNAAKTFRLATSAGTDPGADAGRSYNFGRRTAATVGNNPLVTFGIHETLNVAAQIDDLHFSPGGNLANPLDPNPPAIAASGTLTVENNLSHAAGSTLEFDFAGGSTPDRLAVGGTFTRNGRLLISNPGGLSAGDRFTLFEAETTNGAFAEIILPALSAGLEWDTSHLDDGILEVAAVAGPGTGYAAWAAGFPFAGGEDTPDFDADGDGLANVIEWLFDTDPLDGASGAPLQAESFAAEEIGLADGKTYLGFSARIRKDRPGVTLIPEASASPADLGTPESATRVQQAGSPVDDGDFEIFIWYYEVAIEDASRGFMRLRVTMQ